MNELERYLEGMTDADLDVWLTYKPMWKEGRIFLGEPDGTEADPHKITRPAVRELWVLLIGLFNKWYAEELASHQARGFEPGEQLQVVIRHLPVAEDWRGILEEMFNDFLGEARLAIEHEQSRSKGSEEAAEKRSREKDDRYQVIQERYRQLIERGKGKNQAVLKIVEESEDEKGKPKDGYSESTIRRAVKYMK